MATVQDRSGNNPLDLKYNWENRTAANVAGVIALTPLFPGEIVRAVDTGQRYRGLSLTAGAWGLINVDM
jgi:1,6-anhydro-N-acetylmuramate kinase